MFTLRSPTLKSRSYGKGWSSYHSDDLFGFGGDRTEVDTPSMFKVFSIQCNSAFLSHHYCGQYVPSVNYKAQNTFRLSLNISFSFFPCFLITTFDCLSSNISWPMAYLLSSQSVSLEVIISFLAQGQIFIWSSAQKSQKTLNASQIIFSVLVLSVFWMCNKWQK